MKTMKSSHHPDFESLTDLQLLDEIMSFFARLTVFLPMLTAAFILSLMAFVCTFFWSCFP